MSAGRTYVIRRYRLETRERVIIAGLVAGLILVALVGEWLFCLAKGIPW